MNAKGITKITYWEDLGNTPARVNRRTGEMQISMKHFRKMSPEQAKFVMLHEEAHVVLPTTNEIEADNWAFYKYADKGNSLKGSVKALTQGLTFTNPEHYTRAELQLQRAKQYDFSHYGNKDVFKKRGFNDKICRCKKPMCLKTHKTILGI